MDFHKLIEKLEDEIVYAKENFIPIIRDKSAKFLYDYVKENNIKTVLEIGTAIGFSGSIIIAAGAKELTTIEIKEEYYNIANKTFLKIRERNKKINSYLGDAKDVILDLLKNNCKFDMVFLDGAKGQYINYLPVLKNLLEEDGVIFADNVLLHGMVESSETIPRKKRTMVVNLRKYLDAINKPPFESELIRLEDGIAITKVKGDLR